MAPQMDARIWRVISCCTSVDSILIRRRSDNPGYSSARLFKRMGAYHASWASVRDTKDNRSTALVFESAAQYFASFSKWNSPLASLNSRCSPSGSTISC